MTAASRLETLITSIAELLRQCGHADRAAWLEDRLAVLNDPISTPDAREFVRTEVHGIVLGMSGLMDLNLRPDPLSGYTARSARERLDELADELYQATK